MKKIENNDFNPYYELNKFVRLGQLISNYQANQITDLIERHLSGLDKFLFKQKWLLNHKISAKFYKWYFFVSKYNKEYPRIILIKFQASFRLTDPCGGLMFDKVMIKGKVFDLNLTYPSIKDENQ